MHGRLFIKRMKLVPATASQNRRNFNIRYINFVTKQPPLWWQYTMQNLYWQSKLGIQFLINWLRLLLMVKIKSHRSSEVSEINKKFILLTSDIMTCIFIYLTFLTNNIFYSEDWFFLIRRELCKEFASISMECTLKFISCCSW